MSETWKAIPGWVGWYEASSQGRIRRVAPTSGGRAVPFVLKPINTGDGYFCVGLSKNGRGVLIRLHRLVAAAFHGKPRRGQVVNHLDFDRTNNRPTNLEWASARRNVLHTVRAGRLVPPILEGSENPRAKLSADQVELVRRLAPVVSQRDLGTLCGVSKTAIRHVQKGRNWREVRHA